MDALDKKKLLDELKGRVHGTDYSDGSVKLSVAGRVPGDLSKVGCSEGS